MSEDINSAIYNSMPLHQGDKVAALVQRSSGAGTFGRSLRRARHGDDAAA